MRDEQRDENKGLKEEGKIKNYGRLKINYHKRPCLQVATSLFSAHDSQKYFGKYFAQSNNCVCVFPFSPFCYIHCYGRIDIIAMANNNNNKALFVQILVYNFKTLLSFFFFFCCHFLHILVSIHNIFFRKNVFSKKLYLVIAHNRDRQKKLWLRWALTVCILYKISFYSGPPPKINILLLVR